MFDLSNVKNQNLINACETFESDPLTSSFDVRFTIKEIAEESNYELVISTTNQKEKDFILNSLDDADKKEQPKGSGIFYYYGLSVDELESMLEDIRDDLTYENPQEGQKTTPGNDEGNLTQPQQTNFGKEIDDSNESLEKTTPKWEHEGQSAYHYDDFADDGNIMAQMTTVTPTDMDNEKDEVIDQLNYYWQQYFGQPFECATIPNNPQGQYIITMPLNYHGDLDELLVAQKYQGLTEDGRQRYQLTAKQMNQLSHVLVERMFEAYAQQYFQQPPQLIFDAENGTYMLTLPGKPGSSACHDFLAQHGQAITPQPGDSPDGETTRYIVNLAQLDLFREYIRNLSQQQYLQYLWYQRFSTNLTVMTNSHYDPTEQNSCTHSVQIPLAQYHPFGEFLEQIGAEKLPPGSNAIQYYLSGDQIVHFNYYMAHSNRQNAFREAWLTHFGVEAALGSDTRQLLEGESTYIFAMPNENHPQFYHFKDFLEKVIGAQQEWAKVNGQNTLCYRLDSVQMDVVTHELQAANARQQIDNTPNPNYQELSKEQFKSQQLEGVNDNRQAIHDDEGEQTGFLAGLGSLWEAIKYGAYVAAQKLTDGLGRFAKAFVDMWQDIRPTSRSPDNEINIEVTTTHATPGAENETSEQNNDDFEIGEISPDKITPGASLQDHLNEKYETEMTKKYSFYADFDADNPSSIYQNENNTKQFHYHMADETNDHELTPGDDHQITPGVVNASFTHTKGNNQTKMDIGEHEHDKDDDIFIKEDKDNQTPK